MENRNVIVLVYQGPTAHVFEVGSHFGQSRKRLIRGDYAACIEFVRGMGAEGRIVRTAHCDVTGDCVDHDWTPGRGDIFADDRVSNNRVKVTIN